jgi:dTDP-4-dehydrorhamnose 3,5-epimerase-like enzyme
MKKNSKLVEFIKPEFSFIDERGTLNQLVSSGWKQINIVTSSKGVIRGNHYHKNNNEAFYIIKGVFKLILEQDNKKEVYNIKEGDFFIIKPYVCHTFEYIEDTILIALYDKGIKEGKSKMDTYKRGE